MSGREDRESIRVEVPTETKATLEEVCSEEDLFMWEAVTEAIHDTYGGSRLDTPAALQREMDRIDRKMRNKTENIEDEKNEKERLEQRRKSLEQRHEKLVEQTPGEEEAMREVLLTMRKYNMGMFIGNPDLSRLAEEWFDGDEQSAFDNLQEFNQTLEQPVDESLFEQTNGDFE